MKQAVKDGLDKIANQSSDIDDMRDAMKLFLTQIISAGDASTCSVNVIDAGTKTEHLIVRVWHTGDITHAEYKYFVGGNVAAFNRAMKGVGP